MRELYTSKVSPKPPCLIAKIKLGVSVHLATLYSIPHARGRFDPLNLALVQREHHTPTFLKDVEYKTKASCQQFDMNLAFDELPKYQAK